MTKRTNCMNCGQAALAEFIDLGTQPNGNNFPTAATKHKEPLFPMAMQVCQQCWQVQIAEFPSPEFLFADHPYITGVNVPVVQHFENLARRLVEKYQLAPNGLVFDIGCNDGTLLRSFAKLGVRTLGIDPGRRTGQLAKENGLTVCEAFWSRATGEALKQVGLRPDLITATAVFYHVENLHDFIDGLNAVMTDNTVVMIQCVNLRDLIERNQFDHFYHEHSCIHAIGPLKGLFERHGMRLLDVEFSDIHGGSFILSVVRERSAKVTQPSIEQAIKAEADAGLRQMSTYHAFAKRVRSNADALVDLLKRLKAQGKTVYALGAPVKGNTLLNYCKIGPDLVSCATEVNKFKIGTLTPGTHIPIVDERTLAKQPDYYLVLSWNFLDFFVAKYKGFLLNGGQFIVPVPSVRTLGFAEAPTSNAAG